MSITVLPGFAISAAPAGAASPLRLFKDDQQILNRRKKFDEV